MPVHSAPKIAQIIQENDPKKAILKAVGDISNQEVFADLVLIGTYIRPEKSKTSSIILPKEYLEEDEHQSKVGLVLKKGPLAFADWEDENSAGQNAQENTWVVFAIKDTWAVQINGAPCRFVPYEKLRMRITDPSIVF